jgi:DNA-binding transcriptional LysR family regulator
MKLDPRQLEVLAAIVDSGGLTEGAATLGKSQPSLSRTVSLLEERIGSPLFHPNRRPLQPTELGSMLAEEGRRILRANTAASEIAQRYKAGRTGVVRVGGTPIFMDGVIAGMIAGFQSRHPDVRIDQSYGYFLDLADRLRKGTIDLAICPVKPDEVPEDLHFETLLPGRNVIACRTGHPLLNRKGVRVADLARFSWIAPPSDSPLYSDLRHVLEGLGKEDFHISFSGGGLSAVLSILTASDSLTILPYSVVFTVRRQFGIGALSLRIDHPDRHLGLLHNPLAEGAPAARRLRSDILLQFETLVSTIQHHEKNTLWRR